MPIAKFSLSYSGSLSDQNEIDFYDIAQALIGFQRSLALTAHAVINNEIITQAPSLKGAALILLPFEPGSWKVTTVLVAGLAAASHAVTAPRDTPLGNLVSSAYDYVISESLGFHVDYAKTLGKQYDELHPESAHVGSSFQSRLDSVIEKVETAIINMHRPIVYSETAILAQIIATVDGIEKAFEHNLNRQTYEFIDYTDRPSAKDEYVGRVSSYNINTFKGRIFVGEEGRPIKFELAETTRSPSSIAIITNSLTANAQDRTDGRGAIRFTALKNLSRSGQLKGYYILNVSTALIHDLFG